ncbi:MAG: hypothetical protein P8I74_00810, partial [Phycisphaerales bacterium]|nr:hypothetical protein [Phycisphaerales bacterium]
QGRELPYGPHLAAATVLLIFCRPVVVDVWEALVPTVPMPERSLEPREGPDRSEKAVLGISRDEFPDPIFESQSVQVADSSSGEAVGMFASSGLLVPS